MSRVWKAFFAGYIFNSAARSLYEDVLGKERYLQMVNVGWMSSWVTVPIAIGMICVVLILIHDIKS